MRLCLMAIAGLVAALAAHCVCYGLAAGNEDERGQSSDFGLRPVPSPEVLVDRETRIKFLQRETLDSANRLIHYYISDIGDAALPLVLHIQGSGCGSVFQRKLDGETRGSQNLLIRIVKKKARVMVVEKPGVGLFDPIAPRGSGPACSVQYDREHTLELWAEALRAALRDALRVYRTTGGRLLVIGHSEGGIAAATIALTESRISHLGLLAPGGGNQLFSMSVLSRRSAQVSKSKGASSESIYAKWEEIRANPLSVTRYAWGKPFVRWMSFNRQRTTDLLMKTSARIYVLHGTADRTVPIEVFELMRSELFMAGRNPRFEAIDGADHGLCLPGQKPLVAMASAFSRVVDWFSSP